MSKHMHNWKLVNKGNKSLTLHLDTFEQTTEIYQRWECECGKAEIRATNVQPFPPTHTKLPQSDTTKGADHD